MREIKIHAAQASGSEHCTPDDDNRTHDQPPPRSSLPLDHRGQPWHSRIHGHPPPSKHQHSEASRVAVPMASRNDNPDKT